MRKDFKTFPELKSEVHSEIEAWKQEAKSASFFIGKEREGACT